MRYRPLTFGALLLLLALSAPLLADTLTGRVVGVSDGDTISVLTEGPKGKRAVKIRLHGVDTPESSQAYGARAKQFTSGLAFGKTASADVRDTDRYGRLVAVVTVDGKNLNRELVKAGLAWWYRQYAPDDKTLESLEREAKDAKRGLWADKNPTPPWEFRRGPKTSPSDSASSRSAAPRPQEQEADTVTVYATRTGHKFHRDGCRYLARSRIPVSLKDAQAQGLTPCSVCRP